VRYFETLRKGGVIPERKSKVTLIFERKISQVYPERVVLDSSSINLEIEDCCTDRLRFKRVLKNS